MNFYKMLQVVGQESVYDVNRLFEQTYFVKFI